MSCATMGRFKPPKPIFFVTSDREADFREIADKTGVPYVANNVEGRAGVIEFRFETMDDSILFDIINNIPPGTLAYKAIVGGLR